MDKPIFMIEAPILDPDSATNSYQFLQDLILAFETHYYHQLKDYRKRHNVKDELLEKPFLDDDMPF